MDIGLFLYGLIYVAIFFILVYLVIRRIKIKQGEDFEDRDN
ncbi:hypothetical protein POV27_06760 [Aureisphaera galaxeae]|nr:hypothetical protein [Aureisphaera galaxeae]MDC8003745.1 hypothetical protein [Aureisphaera galaxeae]